MANFKDQLKKRGVALVIVLLVVAIMTVSIMEFSYSVRVDLHLAGNMRDDIQAMTVARAGLELAKGILNYDIMQMGNQKGAIYYVPGEETDFTKQFWSQACKFPPIPIELDQGLTGEVIGVITDEGGKIPLNLLVDPTKGPPDDVNKNLEAVLKRLFKIKGVDENLVEAIEDWIDPDSIPRTYGAEGSSEYSPKNGPMTTVAELRMVKGMLEKGEDKEQMTPFQKLMTVLPREGDEERGMCVLDSLDSPFLTAYPRGFTTTVTINVNTAPLEVIQALFDLEEDVAEEVIKIREDQITNGKQDTVMSAIAPPNTPISQQRWNEVYPLLSKNSDYFSIRSFGRIPNPAADPEDENAQMLLAIKTLKAVVMVNPQGLPRLLTLYYREE